MEPMLTIGKLAKLAGVNIQTVRYYERRGLLPPHGRRESGYRFYRPEAITKIKFVKNAQALGFTLREITELLRLRVRHRAQCGQVKRKAEVKLTDVNEKVRKLKTIERVLRELIKACRRRATTAPCPILKSLEV